MHERTCTHTHAHMHNYTHTYLANELDVFSLNVPHHQDLHLGQEMQGHLIHSISKTRYKNTIITVLLLKIRLFGALY